MKKLKYFFGTLLLLSTSILLNAQEGTKESKLGQFMRSNERSYVVIAVMLTILIGVLAYIARLDKKISKLEKDS
jgi:fucose permease